MRNLFIIILAIQSCSFKPKEEMLREREKLQSKLESQTLDRDGDGESDESEIKKGSDPLIADIPIFSGDFFQEMKVDVEFYNSTNKTTQSLNWLIKDQIIELSWDGTEYKTLPGRLYMETLLKNYALVTDFKKNQFRFYDYNEGVFSHSSPILLEDTLISISKRTLRLLKSGYTPQRLNGRLKSKFNISSINFKSFRNPVFDIYYKSKERQGLIFIESKKIDGTYSFNEDNEVFISFENYDSKIINEAILSGGANFFIKLRDFIIYDNDQSYISLLEKVQSMSVPVTVAFAHEIENQKAKIDTIYVGTAGKPENLKTILNRAFKDDFLMTQTSVDQIRNLSNRQRSYGETGENEVLRWYVGSSEIGDNIYNHQFMPNQGIGLAYLSNKKIEKTPLFVSRTMLSNGQLAMSGILPKEAKDLKIKILANKILYPFEKKVLTYRKECGNGNWEVNESRYNEIKLDYEDKSHELQSNILNDGYIKVSNSKGSVIEGNLQHLLNSQFIKVASKHATEIDISIAENIKQEISKQESNLRVELFLKPASIPVRQGHLEFIDRRCVHQRFDRWNGGDGKPAGYFENSFVSEPLSGFGMAEGGVEVEYDLDIHFLTY